MDERYYSKGESGSSEDKSTGVLDDVFLDPEFLEMMEWLDKQTNESPKVTSIGYIESLNSSLTTPIQLMPRRPNFPPPNNTNSPPPNNTNSNTTESSTTSPVLSKGLKDQKPPKSKSKEEYKKELGPGFTTKVGKNFEKLTSKNKEVAVKARHFGKSDFEKEITTPVDRLLLQMAKAVSVGETIPKDFLTTTIKPVLARIEKEYNDQYDSAQLERAAAKTAKKTSDQEKHKLKAEYHDDKGEKAKTAKQMLLEGYFAWKNLEVDRDEFVRESIWQDLKSQGPGQFFEEVSTNPQGFKTNKKEICAYLKDCGSEVLLSIAQGVIKKGKKLDPDFVCSIYKEASSKSCRTQVFEILAKNCPQQQIAEFSICLIEEEAVNENDPHKIFRANTSATVLASNLNQNLGEGKAYYDDYGSEGQKLNKTVLTGNSSNQNEQLKGLVVGVLKKVLAKAPPKEITQICQVFYERVLQNTGNLKAAELAVMGHLVLRVINPALSKAGGNALTVSTILQSIANKTAPKNPELKTFCLEMQVHLENYIYEKVLTGIGTKDLFDKAWMSVTDDDPASFEFALSVAARLGLIDGGMVRQFTMELMPCCEMVRFMVQQSEPFARDFDDLEKKRKDYDENRITEITNRLKEHERKYHELAKAFELSYKNAILLAERMQDLVVNLNVIPLIDMQQRVRMYIVGPVMEMNKTLPKTWQPIELG